MSKFILLTLLLLVMPAGILAQAFVKDAKAEKDIKAVLDITATGWNTVTPP